jgi:type III secretion protein R
MTGLPDPLAVIAMIAALSLAPFAALLVTSYTKIVVVLSLLRLALGVQQVPPNMVLNGLAIILSIYIMAPIGMQAWDTMKHKGMGGETGTKFEDLSAAAEAIKAPLKGFLEKHIKERERKFFLKSAEQLWPPKEAHDLRQDDLLVLVPGFTISELTDAFQIGFVIYLAFIVIDLVIANILLALGMQMIAPTVIAVPFKLLLFVVLDGWSQLVHGLVLTYR